MWVRVPCPGYWIMEIPSLDRRNPVKIGPQDQAPEHYSLPWLSPNNNAAAVACYAASQMASLLWQLDSTSKCVYFR